MAEPNRLAVMAPELFFCLVLYWGVEKLASPKVLWVKMYSLAKTGGECIAEHYTIQVISVLQDHTNLEKLWALMDWSMDAWILLAKRNSKRQLTYPHYCMFLHCGRKPEYPDRTHPAEGRGLSFHTERRSESLLCQSEKRWIRTKTETKDFRGSRWLLFSWFAFRWE